MSPRSQRPPTSPKSPSWPADQVERRAVAQLVPYARNARTHSQGQIREIARSIQEWGWTMPVLVDESGGIIAGHARVLAAQMLGIAEVPVMVARGWSDAQRRAYVLADNRLAQNSGWDNALVALELQDLRGLGFSLDLTGFASLEITKFLSSGAGRTDPDAVPEPAKLPISAKGDIWICGRHRIICADMLDVAALDQLLGGARPDLTFTSPPYNADTKVGDGDVFTSKRAQKLYAEGYRDDLPSSDYVNFCKHALAVCMAATDGFVFWNVNYNRNAKFEYIAQIADQLPKLIEQICWHKTSAIPFRGMMRRAWEPIYVFATRGQALDLDGVASNFWDVSNAYSQAENHKACFPVELPRRAIELVAARSGIVFDPFGGTGSTMIACEQSQRDARLIEIDPICVDVAVRRWQEFTGDDAVLEGEAKTFAAITTARAVASAAQ